MAVATVCTRPVLGPFAQATSITSITSTTSTTSTTEHSQHTCACVHLVHDLEFPVLTKPLGNGLTR